MKSNFFKNAVVFSLLATLSVSCGKSDSKSGGGGSSSSSSVWSPSSGSTTNTTGSQALTNYMSWYSSNAEAASPAAGLRSIVRETLTYPASSGCSSQPLTVFGVTIGNFQTCLGTSSSPTSTTATTFVNVVSSNTKSSNSKLANILTSTYGALVNVQQQGNKFIFTYQVSVNGSQAYDTVVVDTGINSALNPVYISNTATRKVEQLVNFF